MKRVFNKLVRDKIPEIIEANGERAEVEILDNNRYLAELHNKLYEEVNEFIEEDSLEELADVMEVIYAIVKLKGIDLEEIEKIRKQKADKRGAFDKKIYLKETN
jgi:predicted house-cleaning noncanonical NTP pyrophosphatase (MazG superfamily)